MYLATEIDQILESKKDKLTKSLSYFHLCEILNRAFKKTIPFKFKYETYREYERNAYSISGLYDMDEDVKYIIFNLSDSTKSLYLGENRWKEFRFSVSQVCQHETIHQLQWQHRDSGSYEKYPLEFRECKGSREEEKEYLSDPDEIDAYAHDIAMEIKFFYPKHDPVHILKTISQRKKVWSYSYYKRTFKNDDWNYIRTPLLKKAYRWLPHVTV